MSARTATDAAEAAEAGGWTGLRAPDGTLLCARTWPETGAPARAVLYFVHGLGEHVGRYADLFARLSAQRVRVHAFDQRGHGETLARDPHATRGHIGTIETALGDVDVLLAVDHDCGLPRFLVRSAARASRVDGPQHGRADRAEVCARQCACREARGSDRVG